MAIHETGRGHFLLGRSLLSLGDGEIEGGQVQGHGGQGASEKGPCRSLWQKPLCH